MKRQSEADHNRLVKAAAEHLRRDGGFRNIKAHVGGYPMPAKITWTETSRGHVPDLTADGDARVVVEVETSDSVSHSHTQDQWKLFSAYARQHDAKFWVAVPTSSKAAAQQRLQELGLAGQVWGL